MTYHNSIPMPVARQIYADVSAALSVPIDALLSDSRVPHIARARFMVMRLMRDRQASLTTIGRLMQRHYSTVLHGLSEFERLLDEDPAYALAAAELKAGVA